MDIPSNQYDIKPHDNLNPANAFNRKTGKYKILGGSGHSIRKQFSGSSLFRMGKFDRLQPRDAFILILETV